MALKYTDLGMSVKMRLYSLEKRHILSVFLCFFAAFFTAINIGLFGPKMLNTISTSVASKSNDINLKTGPFVFVTPLLNKFHQKLWITGKPIISASKEEFSKKFFLNIHLYKNKENLDRISSPTKFYNRSRNLHCINEACDLFNILHLDYLHVEQYTVELRLYNLNDINGINIKDFIFTFNSYNPSFTRLELWFRFFFLICNFIVIIIYTKSLKKFSVRDWSIEQKWMFILLRSLLFFNNPLFPLNVLVDSWIPHVLDALFQSTFLSLILVFWLSVFHGVRHNDRNFLTFYVPKFLIVFLIWSLSLILLLWQQLNAFDDPTYNLTMDESSYGVYRIIFLIISIIYILFLMYLIVRACAELRNMPYYDVRIKFSMALMFVVVLTLSIIGILRYQTEPFRQSLFENFTKNYRTSVEFCAIFSIFNTYIYTLAFVYSPAKNASIDNDYRDNQTFAMLNTESGDEDEEDVIYGMNISKN